MLAIVTRRKEGHYRSVQHFAQEIFVGYLALTNRNSLGNLPLLSARRRRFVAYTKSGSYGIDHNMSPMEEGCCGFASVMRTLQLDCYDDLQHRAFCYDSYLKRSRGCPLMLRIACFGDLSEPRSLLQPYIQQISSLTLDFFRCDNSFMTEDFHLLEELTIHKYNYDPEQNINLSLSKLPVNLRRISMVDLSYNRNLKELDFVKDSA